jgi:ABC-type Mn2+/Zn2+ transport system ATPase subunit
VNASSVAYLPQAEDLRWDLPLTVDEVVLMGMVRTLGVGRRPGAREHAKAHAALDRVLAMHLEGRTIDALSGGERQRVLIARALVADPELYLLDEPTNAVDATTEEELMELFQKMAAAGKTLIVATHDLASVLAHFQRVVCLNGRVVADGPVAILRDADVLRETYGGHPPEDVLLASDAHHA